jgi:hypothetical protein
MYEDGEHHPFQFFTQNEWKLAFTIAFLESTDHFAGGYPIGRYHTPGEPGPTGDYIELFKRVVRYLNKEHGYEWTSLDVGQGGSITSAGIVCEGNISYALMLMGGDLPNLPLAFRTAIRFAEEHIDSLDLEPIRQALVQVERDLVTAKKQRLTDEYDPKTKRDLDKFRDEALATVGVVRLGGTVN